MSGGAAGRLWPLLLVVVIGLPIFLVGAALVIAPEVVREHLPFRLYVLSSSSMEPGYPAGTVVLVDRRGGCGRVPVKSGDVVLHRVRDVEYLHRAVAGPGVQSTVVDGRLRLSGAPVRHGLPQPGREAAERVVTLEETLPNGRVYTVQVLVDRSRAVTRDMPVRRLGADEWLTLGDNRDNAMDGRYHGPVPASDICGRVLRVLSTPSSPLVARE